jgi:hypothetical protein
VDLATGAAATLRDRAVEGASTLRDLAASSAAEVRDRAQDVELPDVKLPAVGTAGVKAVAPAAKVLGEGIEAVAESFRSVGRGFSEWRNPPKRQPPYAEAGVALLAGVGGGMAVMYFLDPVQGRRRRTLLVAKLQRWSRDGARALQGTSRTLSDRAQSLTRAGSSAGAGAEVQADVMSGPDASVELVETDLVAGHQTDDAHFSAASDETTTMSYDASSMPVATDPWAEPAVGSSGTGDASTDILGQQWGERSSDIGQEVGSFADTASTGSGTTDPTQGRDRISSSSEY